MIAINILVLGNGFDIAHGLPTSYIDFLHFLSNWEVQKIGDPKKDYEMEYVKVAKSQKKDAYSKCINNMWYKYFKKQMGAISYNKSWINFEEEIGNRVKNIDISKSSHWKSELGKFTECLNFYFYDYINSIHVDRRLPDIYDKQFEYVLSFNYTNTFERLYGKVFDSANQIKYSFVHGKAEPSASLVLGCDNLLAEDFTKYPQYDAMVPFEKTFQRTEKETDKSFKEWLVSTDQDFYVHILGHSLGLTDKSLLIDLILNPKAKIIIYFHSPENRTILISNLIRMLGVNNYNQKSSSIIFKRQRVPEMISRNSKEYESLFSCLDLEINEFRRLICQAKNHQNPKGYTKGLIERFFKYHGELYVNKNLLPDYTYFNENEYLKSLCSGEIIFCKEELLDFCGGISEAVKKEIDQYVYELDDIAVNMRWNHILQIILS